MCRLLHLFQDCSSNISFKCALTCVHIRADLETALNVLSVFLLQDLDDEGHDGAPANGSGPAMWDGSVPHVSAEDHAVDDDSYPEAPEPPVANSGATVARGESFMSEPMLV